MSEEKPSKLAELTGKSKGGQKRGSNDDFEILKLIIIENRGLYLRVLDKIRTLRGNSKESIFDVASKKQKSRYSTGRGKKQDG